MNTLTVEVKDKEVIDVHVVTSVELMTMNYKLNESVDVYVRELAGTVVVKSTHISITGTDFTNWGSDDNYLVDLVLSKVNCVRK